MLTFESDLENLVLDGMSAMNDLSIKHIEIFYMNITIYFFIYVGMKRRSIKNKASTR